MKVKKHCKRILQLYQTIITDLNIKKALQKKQKQDIQLHLTTKEQPNHENIHLKIKKISTAQRKDNKRQNEISKACEKHREAKENTNPMPNGKGSNQQLL